MNLDDLTSDQIRQYYETRVADFPARASREASVRCPFHDDGNPSMSINLENGLWKCHTCGEGGNIITFEKRYSDCDGTAAWNNIADVLKLARPATAGGKIEAVYEYVDAQGKPVFEVVRKRNPDGTKTFSQRHRDKDGKLIYDVKGVKLVPYHLNELVTASEVMIAEGEKVVDALRTKIADEGQVCYEAARPKPISKRGKPRNLLNASCTAPDSPRVAVTCNPLGAGKWRDEYSPYLAGKKIVIFPDHDEPGIKHAQKVAASVEPNSAGVKIVDLFEGEPVPPKHGKDVADFFEGGGTLQQLLEKVKAAPLWKAEKAAESQVGQLLSEVVAEEVEWLWQGRIALGKLTMIEGDPDRGKSLMALHIAASVTTGKFPDGASCPEGGVILLTAEDGLADTIRPRLDAAGGDATRVLSLTTTGEGAERRMIQIPDDVVLIEQAIKQVGAKLVICEPLVAFINGQTNCNNDQHVRRALAPLVEMAERTGVALVVIRHLNKNEDRSPINRGGGSVAFGAAARCVLLAAKDPDVPGQYVLAKVKNNLARSTESMAYRIVEAANGNPRIESCGTSSHTAETLLAVRSPKRHRGKALSDAEEVLQQELANGPRVAAEVEAAALAQGVAPRTLRRAREKLGVVAKPTTFQGPFMWTMSTNSNTQQGLLRLEGAE